MLKNWKWALALVAVLGVPSIASAHELTCEKRANGQEVHELWQYPNGILYTVRIDNVHPTETSVVQSAEDLLYPDFRYDNPPVAIPLGGSLELTKYGGFETYEGCLEMAASDGRVDSHVDNVFRVTWENGETQCTARVTCCIPPVNGIGCQTECQGEFCPPTVGTVTRTMGFFKNHEVPLNACVAEGDIDLGYVTVDSLESALGMLWGSVPRFEDGTRRNQLEQQRFLLARQLLVAVCNERLFGATPEIIDLIEDAQNALAGSSCSAISDLIDVVDAYNNSGDALPFPSTFTPGPSTPSHAESIADDPTEPGSENCLSAPTGF